MLETLSQIGHYAWSFVLILSIIVFIHEFGHYLAARLCGVRVETFSIGFGKEMFGFSDSHGTRWKFSILPFGGYVKMFGDAGTASNADTASLNKMSDQEKSQSFHFKALWQKAIIVAAGPLANFLLSIAVFTYFIFTTGLASTLPVAGEIMPDSPAFEAGLQPKDHIIKIDGEDVSYFRDIATKIALNTGESVTLTIVREGNTLQIPLTPRVIEDQDAFGNNIKRPVIGIKSETLTFKQVGFLQALKHAGLQTYELCTTSLKVMGQMLSGKRDPSELKGPLGIAKLSGDATAHGKTFEDSARTILWFIALLSVNLGLVNLFPIPMLDGGHLLFYSFEAVRGRPMAERIQDYSFKFGFILLLGLMALTLVNDIQQILL